MTHLRSSSDSSLSAYLRILRRRKWIVLCCVVVVPAAAYFFSARQTAQYQSTAEVYINRQDIASALTGIPDQSAYVDEARAAETQTNLATLPEVARRAVRLANVRDVTWSDLLGESTVHPKGASDILQFVVRDPDPGRAARLATAYARAFTQYRGELDTRALVRAGAEVSQKLRTLERQGREGGDLYSTLAEKEQQLDTLQTLQTSRLYVVRTADGAVQVAPTPERHAALGLALGLVLGIGLAFAIDALDTRVRSASDIGGYLGATLLTRIPTPGKKLVKANELVMVAQPRSPAAEAFRVLRTNIDFARLGLEDVRTVLLSSGVEEEGKSTTAANLALALARSGKRVALVDLDLRRPFLDRLFRLVHATGLTDVALGKATLEHALQRIDLTSGRPQPAAGHHEGNGDRGSLDVLVSGPLPPDPGEFVGTPNVLRVIQELRSRYDLVLIDGPPLLRVGDAMTLSSRVDALLIVTRLNVVRRPMLLELRRLLDSTPTPVLGFVVTGAAPEAEYAAGDGYAESYYTRERGSDDRGAEASVNGRGEPVPEEEAV